MKKLILVRHASSVVSEGRDYDEPLSEKGHYQARALARRLSRVDANIYSSPQLRAKSTAIAIAHDKDIVFEPALEDWQKAETYGQMYKRVTEFAGGLTGTNIIVSHGSPIAMILAHQVGGSAWKDSRWGIAPASLSVVQDGTIIAVNDMAHLGISPEIAMYDASTWTWAECKMSKTPQGKHCFDCGALLEPVKGNKIRFFTQEEGKPVYRLDWVCPNWRWWKFGYHVKIDGLLYPDGSWKQIHCYD